MYGSHLTDADPASVFVKRTGSLYFYHVKSNATVWSITPGGMSILEVCSDNPPCYDSLEKSSSCNAITSSCNCLVWFGSINYDLSNGLVVRRLNTERKACVRVAVTGSGPLVIDWSLRTVGTAIPNMLRNIGALTWRQSNLGSILSLSAFIKHVLAPRACNAMQVGPSCLSQTTLHLVNLRVDNHTRISSVYGVVACVAWGVFLVFLVMFSRKLHTEKMKMQ